MEFDDDNVRRRVVEEDRLSSLPDELIHKIMSYFDMKYVVRTCLMSSRWKLLWTSMSYLHFSTDRYRTLRKFDKFVTNVLSHRNNQVGVSSIYLDFCGAVNQAFVRKIAKYAFSHNVQKLTLISYFGPHHANYHPCLFSSQSLQHFTLFCVDRCQLKISLDFPALTTLYLVGITLCDYNNAGGSVDLFSKCVNLKNLTLKFFSLKDVDVLDIITPRLSSLKLTDGERLKAINLIAPQLENLTIINCPINYLNAPPRLSYLCYKDYHPMRLCLSKDGFRSLNKATICLSMHSPDKDKAYTEEDAHKTINMLQDLHNVRYWGLD